MIKVVTSLLVVLVAVLGFLGGFLFGYSERTKEGQLRYYSNDLWAVRAALLTLEGEDIDQAPKTKQKMLERLEYHNQSLHICMVDEDCPDLIHLIIKDTYEKAQLKLESL